MNPKLFQFVALEKEKIARCFIHLCFGHQFRVFVSSGGGGAGGVINLPIWSFGNYPDKLAAGLDSTEQWHKIK